MAPFSPFQRTLPVRAALRAGRAGSWHGGHPGDPRVGLSVAVRTAGDLTATLGALRDAGVSATLLLSPTLAGQLDRAPLAGHEIGGLGDPAGAPGLDVLAGTPVTTWAAPDSLRALNTLGARGLHALPPRPDAPAPGALLTATPDQLPALLADLKRLGYRPVPVRDVPDLRAGTGRDLFLHGYTRLEGHEVGGLGDPAGAPGLDVLAGTPVTTWAAPDSLRALNTLGARGLHALPPRPDAPAPGALLTATPDQLPALLADLKRLGYRPVPVRDVPDLRAGTGRDLFLHGYTRLVEDRFARQHGVIDLAQRADAVMRVAPLDHAPAPLPLPRTAHTAELHLHSPRIVGLASRSALTAYRAYLRSLRDVGAALQDRPELQEAQAVFAVTLFHAPLAQAGFTLLDLPPATARWYGLGFRLLRVAYGTTRAPSEDTPKMAWLPRDEFLKRYG